jgi:hypothetical protein
VKIAVIMAKNEVGGYWLSQRGIFMRKPYFSERKDMADMKRFGSQVLDFNEHGQNSCFSARGKYITGRGLSRIKPMETQGLTALNHAIWISAGRKCLQLPFGAAD